MRQLTPLVEGAEAANHAMEWLIFMSNLAVGLPTLILAVVTIREAHRSLRKMVDEESNERKQDRRILRRILRLLTPAQQAEVEEIDGKHKKEEQLHDQHS